MLGPGALNILVAYIAVTGGTRTCEFIYRFFSSLEQNPAGEHFRGVVVCNGGPLAAEDGVWIPTNWSEYPRKNEGADIGGFIDVAQELQPELLVCLGESVHFHKPGWLRRIVEARTKCGEGMYGFYSSNLVRPHLNTTAFAIDARLLAAYPERVITKEQRYAFEHGAVPFWQRLRSLGRQAKLVTFDGEYGPMEWRAPQNILWRGDQSNCLAWCIHTDRYFNAPEATKRRWEQHADRGL